jgi:hypothetical protein
VSPKKLASTGSVSTKPVAMLFSLSGPYQPMADAATIAFTLFGFSFNAFTNNALELTRLSSMAFFLLAVHLLSATPSPAK